MPITASGDQKFLFVNKTKKSVHLSKSLSFEKTAIQRHVQTDRKRTRLCKRTKPTPNQNHRPDDNSVNQISSNSGSEHRDSTGSLYPQQGCTFTKQRCTSSPTFQRILLSQDPFNASSVPIDKSVAGLLHYYIYYYHPSQWPNEMVLLRHGVYIFHSAVLRIMQTAIADKMAMYCLLGAAACRIQFIDKLPCPLIAGNEVYYIHKALGLMSLYIATGKFRESDQIKHCLNCILFLNQAEAYRGDLSAAKAHLNGAARLLGPMGGLASVKNESLRGQLGMADLFYACVNLEPCSFDCTYDPGSANALELSIHELDMSCETSTASYLMDRVEMIVPLELRLLVEELLESHFVKSRALTSSMSPSRATKVTHWITVRNMAIRSKLLALRYLDPRNHSLRVSIIMWTLYAMNITGRAKTVKLMAPKLRSTLLKIPSRDWANSEKLKLWILLVGFYCADDESEASLWFMEELWNLFRHHVVSDPKNASISDLIDGLEVFQKSFFYDVPAQRARTRLLAMKLQQLAAEAVFLESSCYV